MARKTSFPHYPLPASTQLPLRQMFFSAITQWFPSISLHKNHLWAHILIRNLLLLCCGWRLASPGTQWTGSRCFEKLCWPKRAGSNGGANGLGETPALADDPPSKGSPDPLLLLLVQPQKTHCLTTGKKKFDISVSMLYLPLPLL